jgi:hypothetical protein
VELFEQTEFDGLRETIIQLGLVTADLQHPAPPRGLSMDARDEQDAGSGFPVAASLEGATGDPTSDPALATR